MILMTDRKKMLYKKIFVFLRETMHLRPKKLMMDFELAPRKAAKETWTGIKVLGCNFHYNQALRRKAMSIPGLSRLLKRNRRANENLRMFMRVSLLPLNRFRNGMMVNKKTLFFYS